MSRDLNDLEPGTRAKVIEWIKRCKDRDVDVMVYCTLRTAEEQSLLYARGRTAPGPIVTNAPPWQSWHQYGRAVDAVPMMHGKPIWKYDPMRIEWVVFQQEAENVGLEWAGRWKKFKEFVHVQNTDEMSLAEAYRAAHGDGRA